MLEKKRKNEKIGNVSDEEAILVGVDDHLTEEEDAWLMNRLKERLHEDGVMTDKTNEEVEEKDVKGFWVKEPPCSQETYLKYLERIGGTESDNT